MPLGTERKASPGITTGAQASPHLWTATFKALAQSSMRVNRREQVPITSPTPTAPLQITAKQASLTN